MILTKEQYKGVDEAFGWMVEESQYNPEVENTLNNAPNTMGLLFKTRKR